MKEETCFADERNFSSSEFSDDVLECDGFCDLVKGLDEEVVFGVEERLTNMLGQQWNGEVEVELERSLLLAGYTECMREAIRFLVEEEQYSAEHPLVLGLHQHLVAEQDRVLAAAQDLDNSADNSTDSDVDNDDSVATLLSDVRQSQLSSL